MSFLSIWGDPVSTGQGEVQSVSLVTVRETACLRGVGFVAMDDEGARAGPSRP